MADSGLWNMFLFTTCKFFGIVNVKYVSQKHDIETNRIREAMGLFEARPRSRCLMSLQACVGHLAAVHLVNTRQCIYIEGEGGHPKVKGSITCQRSCRSPEM